MTTKRWSRIAAHVRARPRLLVSILSGAVATWFLQGTFPLVTRCLLGWNVAVWLYLFLDGLMMLGSDHQRMRRNAVAQAEGAATVLLIVIVAVAVSMAGIVIELSAAKAAGAAQAWPHVVFALTTVVGAWLLLPTVFALTYASLFFRTAHGTGLKFPSADENFKPDYGDFLYFSFTIAVASQTADVTVNTQSLRRLVLAHAILSFAFNTCVLAFTVNLAASLF